MGIGVGSMLGAGVFVVWGPATRAAGSWLLLAVALAAVVAVINAMSTAQLAAHHPVAGGAYTYGGRELGAMWGFLAGSGFVVGKTASVAAMALAIGSYAWPSHAPVTATAVIGAAWAVNARGGARTATAATAIAALVLAGLAVAIGWSLTQSAAAPHPSQPQGVAGVISGAALVFFAFAGYARLATLGEEVRAPRVTIPRAIGIAVGIVVVVYLVLGAALLRRSGTTGLADSSAPLALLVPRGSGGVAAIAALAALAAGGAMVALMAGVGRTAMAMARAGDLPRGLATTNLRGVPYVAEGIGAAASVALVWWGNLGFALAMSSVAVLTYYAVANAAAFKAATVGHVSSFVMPRALSAVGVAACLALAMSLEPAPTVAAAGVMALAALLRLAVRAYGIRRRRRPLTR